MSTRIGIITEGDIDDVLLPSLLQRIARDRANYSWPVGIDNPTQLFPIKKRGHGGVLSGVENLIKVLSGMTHLEQSFFVVLLDEKTKDVQDRITGLISQNNLQDKFFIGIAIKEIEAWWLGDRTSTLGWFRLDAAAAPGARYFQAKYKAETDIDPKATLGELIDISDHIQARIGDHYFMDMAEDFGESWKDCANLDEIESQCPRGFKPFCRKATQAFKRELAKQKRI